MATRCPNVNTVEWKTLVDRLGEDEAYKVFLAAGEELPSLPVVNEIINSRQEQPIKLLPVDSETAEDETIFTKEDLSDEQLEIVTRLENRKKSLTRLKDKQPERVVEIDERILELDNKIDNIIQSQSYKYILEVGKAHLDWVQKNILDNPEVYTSDLIDAQAELDVWDDLIEQWLGNDETGERIINVESVREDVIKQAGRAKTMKNDLLSLSMDHYIQNVSNKTYRELTKENMLNVKETSIFTRLFLDLSRVDDVFVNSIDSLLKSSERLHVSMTADFFAELDKKIDELKAKGIDITDDKVQKLFLQKDRDGNYTSNMVSTYSEKWYQYLRDIRYMRNRALNQNLNDKAQRKAWSEWRKAIKENMTMFDVGILYHNIESATSDESRAKQEEKRDEYVEEISEIVGKDKLDDFLRDSKELWDKYQQDLEDVQVAIQGRIDSGEEISFDTELDNWKSRNSPVLYMNQLLGIEAPRKDSEGNFIKNEGAKYVLRVPKKFVDGKRTEWYDRQFENIQNNKTLAEFYDWYMKQTKEFISMLPQSLTENLQSNYLPEVSKTMMDKLRDFKWSEKPSAILDEFVKSISIETQASDTEYRERNVEGAAVKNVPVKFVYDRIGQQRKLIVWLENRIEDMKERQSNGLVIDKDKLKEYESERIAASARLDAMMKDTDLNLLNMIRSLGEMAVNYKAKQEVEDLVLLAKGVLNDVQDVAINNRGEQVKNANGKFIKVKNGKIQLKEMVNYAIDATLYGQKKKETKATDRRIYADKDSRKKASEVRKKMNRLRKEYLTGDMKEGEYKEKLAELNLELDELKDKRYVSLGRIGDLLIKYTSFKGIGYNPIGAMINVVYANMGNMVKAAGNIEYGVDELARATKVMLSSTARSLGGARGTGEMAQTARKIETLVNRLAILTDVKDDAYGGESIYKKRMKQMGMLVPYEMYRRGEYFAQGSVMVAMMMKQQIKLKNGQNRSLWESLDNDGNIKSDVANPEDWVLPETPLEDTELTRFRDSVIDTNKSVHGNYDIASPINVKKEILGRMMSVFRTWMFEGVLDRIADQKFRDQLGRERKGRWRTYGTLRLKRSLHMLLHLSLGKKGRRTLGLKEDVVDRFKISEIDYENMRMNFVELGFLLSLLGTYMFMGAMMDDDEENVGAYRMMLNQITRLQSDITFYISPSAFKNIIKEPVPAMRTVMDIQKLFTGVGNVIFNDNEYYDSAYMGKRVARMIPLVTNLVSGYEMTQKVF